MISSKSRWHVLNGKRQEVLNRAEAAAKVTIPALFVREGHTESTKLSTPYQGLGARAVNTLASKILLALFPPNTPFFTLGLSAQIKAVLQAQQVDVSQVETTLSEMETTVVQGLESTNLRSTIAEGAKHLLVTGNYLIKVSKDLKFTGYSLRSFVVERDAEGSVIEVVIREEVAPATLSDKVRAACDIKPSDDPSKNVEIYTRQILKDGHFHVDQQINEKVVPDSVGKYPKDAPLLLPLRWTSVKGEEYGRGMVQEYQGEFNALDDLSRDLLKSSANAAKLIWLRNPNAHFTAKQIAVASSGDIFNGREGDLVAIKQDKYADLRVTLDKVRDIWESLSAAFLMHKSVQRNAERVTAEEIRFLAQELEEALGGVYSVLATELQMPLLKRTINILETRGDLPKMPQKDIRYIVTTGLEALGRGHTLNKIIQFVRVIGEVFGPEAVATRVKAQAVIQEIAAAMGIDSKKMVSSEEEVQAMQQQAAAQQAVEKIGPGVAREAMKQGTQ